MATSKRRGTKSSAQDNFIGPLNVSNVSASDVGTNRAYNDGAINISWTNPSTGNTPAGYKIYNGATLLTTISHPTNSATVGGLASSTSYTLTVKAYDSYAEASGVNANSVTVTTVPQAPNAPSASTVANTAQDSVSWSAPANNGGKAISNYEWSSTDSKSGTTTGTSVTVSQEAGTAQQYRVRAYNANGWSDYSAYSGSVTTFSFVPFSAFGFTPFGAFGFTPFGAFGFAPFGFSPPSCIEGNTLVDTPSGKVAAKDLNVGDTIYSVGLQEISDMGEGEFDYVGFSSATLTSTGQTETVITNISPSSRNAAIYFNDESQKLYSVSQPIFIKRGSSYEIVPTGAVEIGDILIKILSGGSIQEVPVTSIDLLSGEFTVYQFGCEPADWFVAGDYLVHNK